MEPTNESMIALTEDEKSVLLQYKQKSDQETFALGNLRKQFVAAEKQVLEQSAKSDSDLMEHLKMLAKAKSIPEDGEWMFSFETFAFSKKE